MPVACATPAVLATSSSSLSASPSALRGGKCAPAAAHVRPRRRPRGRNAPAVTSAFALFGLRSKEHRHGDDKLSLATLEAEIAAAPPSTSSAATTKLSLADAVWKVSKDVPLSLRDRVVCTVAAEAVQALCETGLDGASLAGNVMCRTGKTQTYHNRRNHRRNQPTDRRTNRRDALFIERASHRTNAAREGVRPGCATATCFRVVSFFPVHSVSPHPTTVDVPQTHDGCGKV